MAFDKTAHLNALVGNGGFEEKDREWLAKLPDDQLAKITPKVAVGNATTPPSPPPTVTVETDKGQTKLTWDQIEAMMPPEYKAVHNFGKETIQNIRQKSIEKINKSKGNKLTAQQLAGLSTDVLANMAAMVKGEDEEKVDADVETYNNGYVPTAFYTPAESGGVNLGATPPPPEKDAAVANAGKGNRVPGPKAWDYSKPKTN